MTSRWPYLALLAGLVAAGVVAFVTRGDGFQGLARAVLALALVGVVPAAQALASRTPAAATTWERLAGHPAWWLTGMVSTIALVLPAGLGAAAMALPWAMWTVLVALVGASRWWQERSLAAADIATAAAAVYLPVAGAWLLADRLGLQPLGFPPIIVLLTAVHFCYTGFATPIVAAQAARAVAPAVRERAWWCQAADLAALGIVAGTPLTAVGITLQQAAGWRLPELVAVTVLAASVLVLAGVNTHLAARCVADNPTRVLLLAGAACIALGMAAAVAYAFRLLPGLGIPQMMASHGLANAAFATVTVTAWWRVGAMGRE